MNSQIWNRIPCLRLLIPFVTGIILSQILTVDKTAFLIGFFAACLLIILGTFITRFYSYKRSFIYGLILQLFVVFAGFYITTIHSGLSHQEHFRQLDSQVFCVKIIEPTSETAKSYKVWVHVERGLKDSAWVNCSGKTLLYFKKDSLSQGLKYGDLIVIKSRLSTIEGPKNPGEFDYKRHLAYQNVYDQGFVKSGEWEIIGRNEGSRFFNYVFKLKAQAIDYFKQKGMVGVNLAITNALLFGDKTLLESSVKSEFAAAGAAHILAISGLHIGILYLILMALVGYLPMKGIRGKIIKAIIVLLALWMFAVFTGFSASVLRATTMFSIIVIGKSISRNSNIFNSICASALLILVIDPYLVFNVGFQLSYLAVVGIVLLQPRICCLISPKYTLVVYIWQLISVSLAAQIATAPLSLYYFHEFPTYFLLTNIAVIPLVGIIMYLGVICIATISLDVIADLAVTLFSFSVDLLVSFIHFAVSFPFSKITNISIQFDQVITLYIAFGLITGYIYHKRVRHLLYGLAFICLFVATKFSNTYAALNQDRLIVYATSKQSCYGQIKGNTMSLITGEGFENQNSFVFNVKPSITEWKVANVTRINLDSLMKADVKDRLFFSGGKSLLIAAEPDALINQNIRYDVDALVFSKLTSNQIEAQLEFVNPKLIVLDGSLTYRERKTAISVIIKNGIKFHDVKTDKAFIL